MQLRTQDQKIERPAPCLFGRKPFESISHRSNMKTGLYEQTASAFTKLIDFFPQPRLLHMKMRAKAGKAQKRLRAAVDQLFIQADLIRCQGTAAFHTTFHPLLTPRQFSHGTPGSHVQAG